MDSCIHIQDYSILDEFRKADLAAVSVALGLDVYTLEYWRSSFRPSKLHAPSVPAGLLSPRPSPRLSSIIPPNWAHVNK